MIDTYDIIPLIVLMWVCIAFGFGIYNFMCCPANGTSIRMWKMLLIMAVIGWLSALNGLIYRGTTENTVVASLWISVSTLMGGGAMVSIRRLQKQIAYESINII
jgi:hypothetical protein